MKKNKAWIWVLAGITTIVGIATAVALFIKCTGKRLQKDLDFDDSIYYEEEDPEAESLEADDSFVNPVDTDSDNAENKED